ncbi:MAG: primosomal protein N' [Dehalococcoidia bacterium]|nr:primosomal protein N' [Dehalococcoidia bacterium]
MTPLRPVASQSTPVTDEQAQRLAEVAVDALLAPGRTLTYAMPPALDLTEGAIVSVPLGSRRVRGVVIEIHHRSPGILLRDIEGAVGSAPPLTGTQLKLARWLSAEYFCSLFQAASLMFPPGAPERSRVELRLTLVRSSEAEDARAEGLSQPARRLLDILSTDGPLEEAFALRRVGRGARSGLQELLKAGVVQRSEAWPRPPVGPKFQEELRLAVSAEETAQLAAELASGRAPRRAALLEAVLALQEGGGRLPASQARKEYGGAAVTALLKRGVLVLERTRVLRDPLAGRAFQLESPLVLTQAQSEAVSQVGDALRGSEPKALLLEGVTGSGKTEVYLRALAECLAMGKRGIYLVPEIALTPQTVQRLSSRFPGRIGLYHSGLSLGEQYDTWWRVQRGEFDVVLGSRSALFTPQPDVGLIVMDEEHEWTYKQQDATPRYHARDAALKLAELTGAVVLMGSATPDVASYYHALNGRYRLLRLEDRLATGAQGRTATVPLPQVRVVDMREELRSGNRSIFSSPLHDALEGVLRRGEQAILFLNRRGSAGVVQCRDCGHVVRCRRCDLPMTYHGATDRLQCHLCGVTRRPPAQCPACRGVRIRYLGVGTQRVADEVRATFGVPVLRWDRDAAQEQRAHEELMDRFSRGEAPVLVGTQMVAKGLHLPRVTLVGVVLADVGLHVPDLRAGERLFQTLCQVAGRAGRAELPGHVIVQTYAPEHYAIKAAVRQEYLAFYRQEIAYRAEHRNPPFSRLARLMIAHVNETRCQQDAELMAQRLRNVLAKEGLGEADVVGPAPAYPPRVRGRYRWQVVLRLPPNRSGELTPLLSRAEVPPAWTVDVDPAD